MRGYLHAPSLHTLTRSCWLLPQIPLVTLRPLTQAAPATAALGSQPPRLWPGVNLRQESGDGDLVIIARTDALAVTDWDDTTGRCQKYVREGADALCVEALRSPEEAQRVVKIFDVPLLHNLVETGKSSLIPVPELERLGF